MLLQQQNPGFLNGEDESELHDEIPDYNIDVDKMTYQVKNEKIQI